LKWRALLLGAVVEMVDDGLIGDPNHDEKRPTVTGFRWPRTMKIFSCGDGI
jgi:hypothetical protein